VRAWSAARHVEGVDDASEEHGLCERGDGEERVGSGEEYAEPTFRAELSEDAYVQAEQLHEGAVFYTTGAACKLGI